MKKSILATLIALLLLAGCNTIKDEPTPQAQVPDVSESGPSQGAQNNSGESVPLDETGEKLIPGDADRVAVSSGNLTLDVRDSLDNIVSFYESATGDLGAVGEVVENDLAESGAQSPVWHWVGVHDQQPLNITVYPKEEGSADEDYTVVVLYGKQQ